jgi:hypothetical protein
MQGNVASTLVKLLYAFVWQEQIFDIPFILDEAANIQGAELIPTINEFANRFNSYTFYEQRLQVLLYCMFVLYIV